jgi:site-specific recombinase XerD
MALASVAGGMACSKGLRHGFAVACLAQKIPLSTVQKWLGHARMETTAIYLEVSGDEESRNVSRRQGSVEESQSRGQKLALTRSIAQRLNA